MRVTQIIGTVTLNRCLSSFTGARLRLAVPMSLDNLLDRQPLSADCLVLWDELGAGIGSRVAMSEGAEAAQPFRPEVKPVDAYNAAILDELDVTDPTDLD